MTSSEVMSGTSTHISSHVSLREGHDGLLFSPLLPRYDDSTYAGRLWKFIDLTSPQHLLRTKSEIKKCQTTLELAEHGKSTGVSDRDILKCQSMVQACVHPTTNQIIPFYGRMSSFVPVNIPICAGMLFAQPTLPNLIGWQWINQTYNAIFNHSNAAKGGSTSESASFIEQYGDILKGYSGAVFVSVGLAVGLSQWLKRAKLSPSMKSYLQAVVPYTAVASAAMANVGFMRLNELTTGLPVRTPGGVYVGHSQIAARKALIETMISRAVLSVPILLLPPPLVAIALRCNVLRSSKALKAITQLSFLTLAIAVGLPLAIALYPQDAILSLDEIEPELKAKAQEIRFTDTSDGNVDEDYIVFNKGV